MENIFRFGFLNKDVCRAICAGPEIPFISSSRYMHLLAHYKHFLEFLHLYQLLFCCVVLSEAY